MDCVRNRAIEREAANFRCGARPAQSCIYARDSIRLTRVSTKVGLCLLVVKGRGRDGGAVRGRDNADTGRYCVGLAEDREKEQKEESLGLLLLVPQDNPHTKPTSVLLAHQPRSA